LQFAKSGINSRRDCHRRVKFFTRGFARGRIVFATARVKWIDAEAMRCPSRPEDRAPSSVLADVRWSRRDWVWAQPWPRQNAEIPTVVRLHAGRGPDCATRSGAPYLDDPSSPNRREPTFGRNVATYG